MNEEEAKLASQLADFSSAVARLKEVLALPMDPLNTVRDSAIKRFELCAELAWKTLKHALYVREGIGCASPLGCLRAAYKAGIIADDDAFFVEIFKARNLAAHTYKEQLAQEVYAMLPEALKRFETLLIALNKAVPSGAE